MSEAGPDAYDELEDDYRDQLVKVTKGVVSLVPMVGGPLGEIVGTVVPNQRIDRVARYLRRLAERIDRLEERIRSGLMSDEVKADLIVEGVNQAARATSSERIEQIVEAVARGLEEDEADVIRRRRLLILLGELDDDEVALLNAYGRAYGGTDRNAFDAVNRPAPVHMQSSVDDRERDRLYELGKEHLLRLNLLKRNYGTVKKGAVPEFDSSAGEFKHRVEIAHLGRMLLAEIGMPTPFDRQRSGRVDEE